MPGNSTGLLAVAFKGKLTFSNLLRKDFAVVLGLNVAFDAQLFCPLWVDVTPHHVTGRAGGHHGICPCFPDRGNVLLHRFDK